MKKVYLDNAATTAVDPRVLKAMRPYFSVKYGNPSSVHSFGQEAAQAVGKARRQVANFLGAKQEEIIFTSGATEGNNAIIKTVPRLLKEEQGRDHIITSAIEHHCVLDSVKSMEKDGFRVTVLPVNKQGIVEPESLEKAITKKTALVSIMYANNEIGTIQPIKKLSKITHAKGAKFHTDAVQAINYLDCNVDKLGVDFLTLSAHKFYGPKGVGVLYKRQRAPLGQYMSGGAQENHLRAGTLNVPGIVGLGEAIAITGREQEKRSQHALKLRERLLKGLKKQVPEIIVNGSLAKRLPNNLNITVKYVEGEGMLLSLDMAGVACSTGSACSSGSLTASHVILALDIPKEFSHGSLRFTIGQGNTATDINHVIKVLPKIVSRLRKMSPLAPQKYH